MPHLADRLRLRQHQFETGECQYCRYFNTATTECAVLDQEVDGEQVCDAYQGDEQRSKGERFTLEEGDIAAFNRGMKKMQPYKHIVIGAVDTPVGPLLLIEDTMKPVPHRFSLDMPFALDHLNKEHFWTQKEVDNLIRIGKQQ